jgi:hypothetical protein
MLLQVADLGDEAHSLRDETDNARVDVIQIAPQVADLWLLAVHARDPLLGCPGPR